MRWRTCVVIWIGLAAIAVGCEGKSAELCDGGEDEDRDGQADCADSDCWVAGGRCPEDCATIFDEDGDGFDACEDSDCWLPGGACDEDCGTDGDEDADGLVRCDDPDCWVEGGECEQLCDGSGDQDGDGLVACDDADCWVAGGGCSEACEGGFDEDADLAIDCDDDDCLRATACIPSFAGDTQPIFVTHCSGENGECHTDAMPAGGLSFDSYDDMTLPSLYCAGMTKAECSLFRILEPSMPQDCLGCVPAADVAVIERWVEAGYPP
jgi:hypothetical protein